MASASRDESTVFAPKFGADGLLTAIIVSPQGEPLMVAHMNEEALSRTLETGEGWFWSRSRKELWHKGGTSGNTLTIHDIRPDCDQDALWISATVNGNGAACHTGRRSCFYRRYDRKTGALVFD